MPQLRLAVRRLVRQPGFTLLALGTLAVGLGANAAIFSIVDAVLLRPLDYPQAERLVSLDHQAPGLGLPQLGMSEKLYVHYRDEAESFESIGLYDDSPMTVSGLDRPLRVHGARLSPSLLGMLGARPLEGRLFAESEGAPGAERVALVSEGFWRRQLGASPDALGRILKIDGTPTRIAGVLPADFDFPRHGLDVFLPYAVDEATADLGAFGSQGLALLKDGVTIERAEADLRRFTGDLEGAFPEASAARVLAEGDFAPRLRSLRDHVVGDVGPVLVVLLATVGFVLLLATVNVATLFLARAEKRGRETAIRSALGASRSDLARSSLAEGMLLSLAAGAFGLLIAQRALGPLLGLAPDGLPRAHEVAIDGRTVVVVAVLSLLSGLVFSLIPIFRARLSGLAGQLKDGGRSSTLGQGGHRVRRTLVAAQMAISVVLLVGAGLMARSFERLAAVEPGFRTDGLLSFTLALPSEEAVEDAAGEDMVSARFFDSVLERLEAIPGVSAVASATAPPLSGYHRGSGHRTKDEIERGEGEMPTIVNTLQVSPGFFELMGMVLLEGRSLEADDWQRRTGALVVSKSFADLKWPGESAIGKKLFPGGPDEDDPWFEVVGVAGDIHFSDLTGEQRPMIYYPWANALEDLWVARRQSIILRVETEHAAVMDAARRAVWSLDADLPLADVRTLDSYVRDARASTAFTALMLLIAAAVAVLLGAVGTYGLISFLAAERRGEIGVRLALGARRLDVLRLIVREGLLLAAVGGTIGLLAAAALARGLDAVLFEVTPHDPLTFALVPVVLLLVAFAASALPARRAAALDPVSALREE